MNMYKRIRLIYRPQGRYSNDSNFINCNVKKKTLVQNLKSEFEYQKTEKLIKNKE